MRGAMDYGERVLGIQAWDGTRLSFKIPVFHKWFPEDGAEIETYTLDVPGSDQPLIIRPEQVSTLRDALDSARAAGRLDVSFDGKTFPLTPELEDTVNKLVGISARKGPPRRPESPTRFPLSCLCCALLKTRRI